jgi:hypothetical protein
MIRHARPNHPQSVGTLAQSVPTSGRFRPRVTTIGDTALVLPGYVTASFGTVALTPVAMAADAKDCPAGATVPDSENQIGHVDPSSPITLHQRANDE